VPSKQPHRLVSSGAIRFRALRQTEFEPVTFGSGGGVEGVARADGVRKIER
jgi:hypothetical protein